MLFDAKKEVDSIISGPVQAHARSQMPATGMQRCIPFWEKALIANFPISKKHGEICVLIFPTGKLKNPKTKIMSNTGKKENYGTTMFSRNVGWPTRVQKCIGITNTWISVFEFFQASIFVFRYMLYHFTPIHITILVISNSRIVVFSDPSKPIMRFPGGPSGSPYFVPYFSPRKN